MKNTATYLIFALLIIFSSCNKKQNSAEEITSEKSFCLTQQLKKTTTFSDVHEQPIYDQLTLTGKVEYNENDLVSFKSLLSGVVSKVNFELGDYVKYGQILAIVRSVEIQGISQEKRTFQNQIESLNKQLKIKKELLKDGLASQPEVSELEFELKSAQIEIDRINKTLNMYRAVGDGQFQILAPKNGYIVQKGISVGQSISSDDDQTLFSISNLNQVWVMVNIYANNLKYVKVGNIVKVKTVAFPDRIYNGKIDKIYNVFDDNEHVTKARVVLENNDLNLLPGLSADIIIDKDNSDRSAFAVPKKAIVFENNKEYVVIYKDTCNLSVKKVTPITSNDEFTYVKEKFSDNEKVVTKNALIILEELNN